MQPDFAIKYQHNIGFLDNSAEHDICDEFSFETLMSLQYSE